MWDPPERLCDVPECAAKSRAYGYCASHADRFRRHGDPLWMPMTDSERFDSKIDRQTEPSSHRPDLGSCWVWTGSTIGYGYGRFPIGGKTVLAHRWAWVQANGPIPDGLELDHLCRVTRCVRPSHLEPVTCQENIRRARVLITHCPQGHPYDEANTYRDSRGGRSCRACQAERARQRKRALRGSSEKCL